MNNNISPSFVRHIALVKFILNKSLIVTTYKWKKPQIGGFFEEIDKTESYQAVLLQHRYNRLTHIIHLFHRQPRHTDAAGISHINTVFTFQFMHLLHTQA